MVYKIALFFRCFHPLIADLGLECYSNRSCRSCALETGLSVFCKGDGSVCIAIGNIPVLAICKAGHSDRAFLDLFKYLVTVNPSVRIRIRHNSFIQTSRRYYDIYGPCYFFI